MKNTLHQLKSSTRSQMMSYLITTEDGKHIVIDGGLKEDAPYLLSYLKEISGMEIPVVDAWFLTHAHYDHITAFMELVSADPSPVKVEKIFYNFPSEQYIDKYESHEAHAVKAFYQYLPLFADRAVIVSATDQYRFGDAVFDILYSPDPDFTMNAVNNSSLVIRMSLGSKKVLFLGDLGIEAGNKLLKQHGNNLKSDYCQMAHHGQNGVTKEVYEAISPKGCLWCTPKWLWDNDAGDGYNTYTWQTIIVRGWMDQMGITEHYVIKDGTQVIELSDITDETDLSD